MNLSDFVSKYCNGAIKEALIRWFRTYDRMEIKSGLLDLKIKKRIDYKKIEEHFKKEINRLIEKEVS